MRKLKESKKIYKFINSRSSSKDKSSVEQVSKPVAKAHPVLVDKVREFCKEITHDVEELISSILKNEYRI